MKAMPMGEFYVWFCDWCDSRNMIPWTSTVGGKVACGGCHKEFPVHGANNAEAVPPPAARSLSL